MRSNKAAQAQPSLPVTRLPAKAKGLSILQQVLVLVTLPLLIQLGSIAWLAQLQNQAEQQLLVSARAKQVSDAINRLSSNMYEIVSTYSDETSLPVPARQDPIFQRLYKSITRDIAELHRLSADDPRLAEAARVTERTVRTAILELGALKESFDRTGEKGRDERKPMWKRLRHAMHETLDQELMYIGREKSREALNSPIIQGELRKKSQTVMIGVAVLDLLLTVVIALFITRRIGNRLSRVADNTYRLASRLPLNPPLTGNDEIVVLDQTFHRMARELKEASRKESAIVEHARDIIGSIDAGGSLIAINQAAKELLGRSPDELLGTHFIDLVAASDIPRALDYLENLRKSLPATPLDLRMKCGTEKFVDVLFSGHWSDDEQSTFFVIHDMTAFREAERLRQEVLAMVTHDLRSPLNTITNVLGFIKSGRHGQLDDKGIEYLDSANRNSRRMLALINDMLDVERIKAGMMELDIAQVSIDEALNALEVSARGLADEAGIEIIYSSSPLVVRADEEKLDRVLINLVSNAIKFSPRGKCVYVTASRQDNNILFTVEDEGPGIAEDRIDTIFDRFNRGENTGDVPGSGLGLSICKALVELMGGKIQVTRGKVGARFSFTLPVVANK